MIKIDYKKGKFYIECTGKDTNLVTRIPERRFSKATGLWVAPALNRNITYLREKVPTQALSVNAFMFLDGWKPPALVTEDFPSDYKFMVAPMAHQMKTLNKFWSRDYAGLFLEQGLGKTYTSINLTTAWHRDNQINAVLVICPSSVKQVWTEELNKYCTAIYSSHVMIAGKGAQASRFISRGGCFKWLIVGIEALSRGNAMDYAIDFVTTHSAACILDESSRIKNNGKERTKKSIKLAHACEKRLILSGTSITTGLENLYTQMNFLDPDILGFSSYYSFKAYFCEEIRINVTPNSPRETLIDKIVDYKNLPEFIELIQPHVLRIEKKDAIDLPDKVFTERYVTLNKDQQRMYESLMSDLALPPDFPDYEIDNILEKTLRLRQMIGGFYPIIDEHTGDFTMTPVPGVNPKLSELMDILDETTGKVVVWAFFKDEVDLISKALSDKDIWHVKYVGGLNQEQKLNATRCFQELPNIRVFIGTSAAAYGLTLTAASTSVYFSLSNSLDTYLQSLDRIHRIGQKNKCTYIHLLAEKTIEKRILDSLREQQNLANATYDQLK